MNVVCIMDMGKTPPHMSAKPLLPPRQETTLKKAVWAKWMKIWIEKYFLFRVKHGLTHWP
jgi:sulfide:quinone oxidoreductase